MTAPALRPVATVGRPVRSSQWMLDQLPVGLHNSAFFVRFVSIFQQLGETLLEDADNLEHLPDLTVTPDPVVRWLGSWIGVGSLDPSLPSALQRRIVASAAETLSWRGTRAGLTRFLTLTTGEPATVVDGGGVWRDGEAPADTAWVRMTVASTGWLSEADFVALVRDEVPAHLRSELWVGERLAWSSVDEPGLEGPDLPRAADHDDDRPTPLGRG